MYYNMFTYVSLLTGDPPRKNWYQDLFDDPGCGNDPVRSHHRSVYQYAEHLPI